MDEKDVAAPLADATFTLYAIDMDKAQGSAGVEGAKTFFSDGTPGPDGSVTFGPSTETGSDAMATCRV